MQPEPVSPAPPRRVALAAMTQRWRDVTFLHWPLDPGAAVPLLPPGTRPDVLAGRTFVGVVALHMRVGIAGTPPLPWVGTFGQVNVRLYAVDEVGRRGVVFLSLSAGRLLPVLAGRFAAGLPYRWASVDLRRDGDRRTWSVTPQRPPAPHGRIDLRVGPRREPDELERFLTARWSMFAPVLGRTVHAGVEHDPWPLHAAELLGIDGDLFAGTGLPAPEGPPISVLWSPGLPARVGAVR